MRRITILFLVLLFPLTVFSGNLASQLEKAIIEKDEHSYFNLFLHPEEERGFWDRIKNSSIFDVRVREEIKDGKRYLTVGILGKPEIILQQWKVKVHKGIIAEKEVIANFTNLMWFEPEDMHAYRVKMLRAKVKDIVFEFKKGTLYLFPTFVFIVGNGYYVFNPSSSVEQQHLYHVFQKKELKGIAKALLLRYSRSSKELEVKFEIKSRKEASRSDINLFKKLSTYGGAFYSRFFGRYIYVQPPEGSSNCVFVDKVLGELSFYYNPYEIDGIVFQNLRKRRLISLYSEKGFFFAAEEPDVLRLSLDLTILPKRKFLIGRARVKVNMKGLKALKFNLSPEMDLLSVKEKGKELIYLRSSGDQISTFPEEKKNTEIEISYKGPLKEVMSYSNMVRTTIKAALYGGNWVPSFPDDFYEVEARVNLAGNYLCVASGQMKRMSQGSFFFASEAPVHGFYLFKGILKKVARLGSKPEIKVFSYPAFSARAESYGEKVYKAVEKIKSFLGPFPYKTLNVIFYPSDVYLAQSLPSLIDFRIFKGIPRFYRRYLPEFILKGDEQVIYHEVIHQWLGNLTRPRSHKETWINEGLTHMLSLKFFPEEESIYKDMRKSFLSSSFLPPLILGARIGHYNEDLQSYFVHNYLRASFIFKMLEEMLGEETFFRALKSFIESHRFKTYAWYELADHFSKYLNFEARRFFLPWIHTYFVPRVNVRLIKIGEGVNVEVLQSRRIKIEDNFLPFVFPLKIKYKVDGQEKTQIFIIREKKESFSIPSTRIKIVDYFLPLKLKVK